MKKKLIELRQLQDAARVKVQALIDLKKGDNQRSLTDDEKASFVALEAEIEARKVEMKTVEDMMAMEADNIAAQARKIDRANKKTPEAKVAERFSFIRAVSVAVGKEKLNGIEAEMHQEAVKEARDSGVYIEGTGIPSFLLSNRTVEVATPATAGNLVETELRAITPGYEPNLQVVKLGATVMSGLVGDIDLVKETGLATARWEGEKTTSQHTDVPTEITKMSPKRLSNWTDITLKILRQSSISTENWMKRKLLGAVDRKVDETAINGSGTGHVPLGIANMPNVNTLAIGENGGAISRGLTLQMPSEIETLNADLGNMAYLTSPKVKFALQDTLVDPGSGKFVWDINTLDKLLGYRAAISSQVPGDITKGTGTDLHMMLFGVWSELLIGQWAGIDLVVDPYAKKKEAIIELAVNSFWDIQTEHQEAFSVIKDIDVTARLA